MGYCDACGKQDQLLLPATFNGNSYNLCDKCYECFHLLQYNSNNNHLATNYFCSLDIANKCVQDICNQFNINQEQLKSQAEKSKAQNTLHRNSTVLLTSTGLSIPGYKTDEIKGVIMANVIQGTGILAELGASLSDLVGARSNDFEYKLSYAQRKALEQLKGKAEEVGANAIIGIQHSIASTSNNMLIISIIGTAIRASKAESGQENKLTKEC